MSGKKHLLRTSILIIFSLFFSILLVNTIGKRIEIFETRIYQKISGKSAQYIDCDSTGIPFVFYEGKLGKQYNTVTVAERAIKLYDEKDKSVKGNFFSCIGWLKNNYTILNDSSIIYLDYYDWPSYKMTTPWRSAMNQGRAMQAFIKAFEKTRDTLYLNLARKSMNTLHTEVRDGGVTYMDSTGYWYEEYADDMVPQSRVLNGMIVVLQALSDFHRVTNDLDAFFLFKRGVDAVKKTLHFYDNKGHSNCDVLGKPASSWYHKFHIELLDFLYTETHESIFNEYKQKWMLYKEPSYIVNLIRKPTRIGIFAVFSLFAGVLMIVSLISYFIWFRKKSVEKLKR
jgi:heparosan-N-sulfate-glucuronate 5-epimerase